MLRRLGLLAVLAAVAGSLGGCVAIKSVVGAQQDVVGKLRVTVVVCKVDTGTTVNHPGCNLQSNAGEGGPTTSQLLFALRVPEGTGAPTSVSGTTNDGTPQTIAFARNAGYEARLTALAPPGGGRKWIGYLSSVYTYAGGLNGTPAREIAIAADLTLPRPAHGSPVVGALPVVPVAGGREVAAGNLPGSRPVTCATPVYGISTDNTVCVDSPAPGSIGSAYNFPTRDFGVVSGKATASPGQTVTVPFGVRGAGALPAGLTATLTAATTLPGASAVPSAPSVPLANGSDTRITVPVTIPADSPPGVFDVSVTGRLDNGQARTGVAKLTVRDRQKPVLSKLKAKPKRFKAATKSKPKRGTNVSFTLSEAAKVRLTVERCAKRKRGRCVRFKGLKGGLTKAGVPGANSFRFNGRLRGKALEAGGYRLVLTPKDGAANVGKAARVAFAVRR